MKLAFLHAMIGGAVACALFLTIAFFCSCSAPLKTSAESAYLAEQISCVDGAKTLEESHICRALVKAKWGRGDAGKEGGE